MLRLIALPKLHKYNDLSINRKISFQYRAEYAIQTINVRMNYRDICILLRQWPNSYSHWPYTP